MRSLSGMIVMLGLLAPLTLSGCGDSAAPPSGTDAPRYLADRLEAVAESQAPEVLASGLLHGFGGYEISAPTAGEASAELRFWFSKPGEVDGSSIHLDFVASHDPERSALGARYLDESHLTAITAVVGPAGAEVDRAVAVRVFDLSMDLVTGVTYARVGLDVDESMIDLDVRGFVSVVCRDAHGGTVASLGRGPDPTDPSACTAVFDAIRAVPDDPDAPPAPWDPSRDGTAGDGADGIALFD